MSRSLKKGPYINIKLEKKVLTMNESGKKAVVKTWARASMISPDFVGHTIAVHNGNKFIPVLLPKIWLVTSWESFLQLVHSVVIRW
jgi:small subunit ribosomal protein S19